MNYPAAGLRVEKRTNIADKTPSQAAINCWRGGAITAAPATESPRESVRWWFHQPAVAAAAATAIAAVASAAAPAELSRLLFRIWPGERISACN